MMKKIVIALFFSLIMLTGCGESTGMSREKGMNTSEQAMTGSDRDVHGCIESAGYRWCERVDKCVRPWELAKKKGFEKSENAFKNFCKERGQ